MITMHCPSCGAEGRIPENKVDTRLLCKKCLQSFHMTTTGKILPGDPFDPKHHQHHETPGHEFDKVDEELALIMGKARLWGLRTAKAFGVLVALWALWLLIQAIRPVSHDEQVVRIAQAIVRGDVSALQRMATAESRDAAAMLTELLRPELSDRVPSSHGVPPDIQVARRAEASEPGLSEVVASVHSDQPVTRQSLAVTDVSATIRPAGSVEIPLVLAGSDRSGWLLDGEKSLAAYRKARTGDLAKLGRKELPGSR